MARVTMARLEGQVEGINEATGRHYELKSYGSGRYFLVNEDNTEITEVLTAGEMSSALFAIRRYITDSKQHE